LMVSELDDTRGLERWLEGLDVACEARRWTVDAHLFDMAAERGDEWPAERRWGPPRELRTVIDLLREPEEREARSVVLAVEGVHSGVLLALERGVHVWRAGEGRSVVEVRLLTRAIGLDEKEWAHATLTPPMPTEFEALCKAPAVRTTWVDLYVQTPELRRVELRKGQHPLEVIERVACQHLVELEFDPDARPLEEIMEGPLDEGSDG